MVNINQEKLYATQWNESAKYFYETKRYQWMSEKLVEYDIVLEIGCGTGYSTLALVEAGHTVIAGVKAIILYNNRQRHDNKK